MNRIDRLTAILVLLQSRKFTQAELICERFQISLRTVYRDMRALDEAGVPIAHEVGKGYFIMEGYHLPPVMFTPSEAQAMLLGGKLTEQFADSATQHAFQGALTKIRAALRGHEREQLETLEEQVRMVGFYRRPIPFNDHIPTLQQALADKKVVFLEYRSNYKSELTRRKVEPIGLCHYGAGWHLIAFCQLRQGYRDFRTDRIQLASLENTTFDPQKHPSLDAYLKEMGAENELTEVRIRIHKEVARYMSDQRYYMGFVEELDFGDQLEMCFVTFDLKVFGRWLLMFGNAVEIVSPSSLQTAIQGLLNELNEHFLKS